MKKFLSVILMISLICMFSLNAFAADKAEITMNSEVSGNRLSVDVDMTYNPGIAGAYLCFTYDQSKMKLVGIDNGVVLSKSEGYGFTPSQDLTTYPFVVLYDGVENSTKTGTVCTLHFKFLENAAADNYTVGFSKDETFFAGVDSENKPILIEAHLSDADIEFDGYKDMSLPITLAISNGLILIVAIVIIALKRKKR